MVGRGVKAMAVLEAQGHLNEAGERYATTAISRMLAS
jgi:hypothetical protein